MLYRYTHTYTYIPIYLYTIISKNRRPNNSAVKTQSEKATITARSRIQPNTHKVENNTKYSHQC